MISIILTILKIIGIVIGCIIGLAILLALLILFVPIRYKGAVEFKNKDYEGGAKIHWLLHIISFEYDYAGEEAELKFRIFGIPVRGFSNQGKEKAQTKEKRSHYEEKYDQKVQGSADKIKADAQSQADEIKADAQSRADKIKANSKSRGEKRKAYGPRSIVQLIKEFFSRFKSFPKKFFNAFKKYREESSDPVARQAYELIKKQAIILAKHYKPRKLKGQVEFGFEDPANTGMLVGFYYMIFPVKKSFKLTANFSESTLDGNVIIGGHARLNHLLMAFIRLYRNEKTRQLFKK